MQLEQVTVVKPRNAGLREDVERADALVLRSQPLAGLDHGAAVRPLGPPEVTLPTDNRPLDEGAWEGNEVGDKLVEGVGPTALCKLVVDADFHPVDPRLRHLENLEPVLLRHKLLEFSHLDGVGSLPRHLDDLHDALSERLLESSGLGRSHVGDGCRSQVPRGRASVEQDVPQPALSRAALNLSEHHVDFGPALCADARQFVRLVLAVALTQSLKHDVVDGLLGDARRVPAGLEVGRQPEDEAARLPRLKLTLDLLLLLASKLVVTDNAEDRQTSHTSSPAKSSIYVRL